MLSKKQIEQSIVDKVKKDLKKELKTQLKLPTVVGGLPPEFKLNSTMKKLKKLSPVEKMISAPNSVQTVAMKSNPNVQYSVNEGRMSCRVKHREFVQDVGGTPTGNFGVWFSPRINPGSGSIFPWLADISDRFEKYKFHSLCFEYRSSVGTTSAGKVLLSVDFDVLDSIPATKVAMGQQSVMAEGPVWSNFQLPISPKNLSNAPAERYVAAAINGNQIVSNADMKTYDLGRLTVATAGVAQPPTLCGELWVEYDVELITPTTPPASGNAVQGASTTAIPFVTQLLPSQNGNVYFTPILGTNTFRCGVSGEYKVFMVQYTSSGAANALTFTIQTSFSSDTAISNDVNMQSFSTSQARGGANIRAREGDVFAVNVTLGGLTTYVLYMFEFPYS